jgi:antitoxin VapB
MSALSVKDPEAHRLATELSDRTGQSITEAVIVALRERLRRESAAADDSLLEEVRLIVIRVNQLPVLDKRPADEILGYH